MTDDFIDQEDYDRQEAAYDNYIDNQIERQLEEQAGL
jgi:hypothetical protein